MSDPVREAAQESVSAVDELVYCLEHSINWRNEIATLGIGTRARAANNALRAALSAQPELVGYVARKDGVNEPDLTRPVFAIPVEHRLPPGAYYEGTYRCPPDLTKRCPWCEDGPQEEDGVLPSMCGRGERTDIPPSAVRDTQPVISPTSVAVLEESLRVLGPSADGAVERDLAAARERETVTRSPVTQPSASDRERAKALYFGSATITDFMEGMMARKERFERVGIKDQIAACESLLCVYENKGSTNVIAALRSIMDTLKKAEKRDLPLPEPKHDP